MGNGLMKSSMARLALASCILGMLILLGWGGGILYWHIRIADMLKGWEQEMSPRFGFNDAQESSAVLHAGCRALPQMVTALNSSVNRDFQERVMSGIVVILANQQREDRIAAAFEEFGPRWEFRAAGTELEQRYKIEDFNAWWAEHRSECHQWWRFWSDSCGSPGQENR
jgi:hypothetical protein